MLLASARGKWSRWAVAGFGQHHGEYEHDFADPIIYFVRNVVSRRRAARDDYRKWPCDRIRDRNARQAWTGNVNQTGLVAWIAFRLGLSCRTRSPSFGKDGFSSARLCRCEPSSIVTTMRSSRLDRIIISIEAAAEAMGTRDSGPEAGSGVGRDLPLWLRPCTIVDGLIELVLHG